MTDTKTTTPDPSTLEASAIALSLNVDMNSGLTADETAKRLEQYGWNELESAPPVPAWKKFLLQFKDPLVYLLIAATVISVIAWFIERTQGTSSESIPFDAIVIMIILILNAILGFIQENKAEAAVEALSKMTAPEATVLRDGKQQRVPTTSIVPGDILILSEGDTIPADARLISAASLRVAEASLTGESVPVSKKPAVMNTVKALGDRANMVFNGTSITQGTGKAIVTSTGMHTQVGKIAGMLADDKQDDTPLQKEINKVSKMLGIAVISIAAIVLIALGIMQGFHDAHDIIESMLLAVSLAVAAVPEGLAAILSVVLALGVQRMAKHHAIVKELSSVETLGSASVICSDKTGTLTKNEMTVETVCIPTGNFKLSGSGYEPSGVLSTIDGNDANENDANNVKLTLGIGSIVNDADLRNENDKWMILGDPTEASILVAYRKLDETMRFRKRERIAEIPFTSDRKMMTSIARDGDNELIAYAKGAPDVLLAKCSRIRVGVNVRPLTDDDRATILAKVEELSSNAYRTLGMAYRPFETDKLREINGIRLDAGGEAIDPSEQADILESDFIWTGMVGIIDPPRTEVKPAITEAHKAGIRTIMITGDHPLTASRIASDLGIIDGNAYNDKYPTALTGDKLDELINTNDDMKSFDDMIAHVSVYARVAPEHKLKIVESLQRNGNIVAMTGDGVNDAPAVKTADIGVAMGITGTEVTKESAKMILADDNFGTIVNAVREGRGIFDNIRKFLRYLLSSNVGEVITVFMGVMLAGVLGLTNPASTEITVPLLAVQLLWINLLTDAAPALAMGVDPISDGLMDRKPRKLTDHVINVNMWMDIVFVGIIMAAVTLIGMDMHLDGGLFTDRSVSMLGHEAQMTEARTMGFTILVFAQLFNALASRSAVQSAFKHLFNNHLLWLAIGLSIILQVLVIYVPFLNTAFGTTPLDLMAWIECILLASIILWATEIYKLIMRAVLKRKEQA